MTTRAGHLDVEHATDGSILHPRNAVVGQEIIMPLHREHNALGVNHQHAYQCVRGIFAFASEYWTHNCFYSFFVCKYTEFFGKFQEKCEKYVYAVLRSLGDRYLGVTAS